MTGMEHSTHQIDTHAETTPDARERILTAAASLFAIRGFEGVSTTQIAKKAGITQPLIHYHFKNKEALWKAAVGRLFGRINHEFSEQLARLPAQDKQHFIVEALRNYVTFCAKHPEFCQFVMREGAQNSERLEWMTAELIKPLLQPFYDAYLEGATEGWLKPIPFPQLVMLVTGGVANFFALSPLVKLLYDTDPHSGEEALAHSDAVVDIIVLSIFKGTEVQQSLKASQNLRAERS